MSELGEYLRFSDQRRIQSSGNTAEMNEGGFAGSDRSEV
jgi:hypothetical protein